MEENLAEAPATQASLSEIPLPETLDLTVAIPLASTLLSARGGGMRLDGSKVKTLGAQCMQVIVSARQTWDRDGFPFTIVNPSEDFLVAFTDAGLDIETFVESETGR